MRPTKRTWLWTCFVLLSIHLAACSEDGASNNTASADASDTSALPDGDLPDSSATNDDTSTSPDTGTTSGGDADGGDADGGDADGGDTSGAVEPITLDLDPKCNLLSITSGCAFPYPSAYYERPDDASPTGVRLDVAQEVFSLRASQIPIDTSALNRGDGASPVSPILLHFGVDVDLTGLPDQHHLDDSLLDDTDIALFNMKTGQRVRFFVEMDRNVITSRPNRYALIIRPMEPMEMGARHAVILTKAIKDIDGAPLPSSPTFDALRDKVPTTNADVEAIRPAFEPLFTFAAAQGYAREDLFLAWDFMVASEQHVLGSVLSMRTQTLALIGEQGLSFTISKVEDDPDQYLSRLVEGTFEVPTFINDQDEIAYDADGEAILQPTNQSFDFTMVIPKKAVTEDRSLPLVVFGHGLFGQGRPYLNASWSPVRLMAEAGGVIIIATDWIGLSGDDINLIIEEVVPDLNRLGLVTDRLQQALINNLTLTKLAKGGLQADPRVKLSDAHPLIDTDQIHYYGISLGGIQGASFVSISDDIQNAILAVPGAVWSNMLSRSSNWPQIKIAFDIQYPDPLLQQLLIAMFQSRFDHADPANLTKLMFKSPLPDAPANRHVLIQESFADCQVPNMSTRVLARAIGLPLISPIIEDVDGLEVIAAPHAGSGMVQFHFEELTAGKIPTDTNVPPLFEDGSRDNGAHSAIIQDPRSEAARIQVGAFVSSGVILMPCDGTCNPD